MADQILVLRETARAGPGGNGGVVLPPGSELAVYGDSLSNRVTWQPTVANYFGIPWKNGGVGSTTAVDNNSGSGSNEARLGPFITSTAATIGINTIWFGYNDWAQSSPQVDIGTDAEFAKPLATRDRTTFKGALSYIVERLYTAKPLALHILVTIPGSRYDDARSALFAQAAIDVARYHAVPYIDMFTGAGMNRWNYNNFLADHVHTDATSEAGKRGSLRWANVFINRIKAFYNVTTFVEPAIAELSIGADDLDPPPTWAVEPPSSPVPRARPQRQRG